MKEMCILHVLVKLDLTEVDSSIHRNCSIHCTFDVLRLVTIYFLLETSTVVVVLSRL